MSASLFRPSSASLQRYHLWIRWIGLAGLIALAVTPVIIDRAAHDDAFFTPKWAWIATFSLLAGISILNRMIAGRAAMFPFDAVFFAALLWLLWNAISIRWAPSHSLAFDRVVRLGWVTLALWSGIQWLQFRRAQIGLAWFFIFVASITATWTLVEDFVHAFWPGHEWVVSNLPDWRGYLAAGLGNTNHIGDLVTLALFPVLAMFGEARRRPALILLYVAGLLFPAALIVSYSVGSLLGLLVGAVFMLVIWLSHGGHRWFLRRPKRWLCLLVGWLLVIAFFSTDHPINPHRPGIIQQGFGSERWHAGGATRLAIWAESLEIIRLHPLLGVGAGNFTYVFPEMDSTLIADKPDLLVYQGLWTNAAHNELLQAWSELGAIGLFLLIAWIGLAFHTVYHRIGKADRVGLLVRTTLGAMLAAYVVQSQMNFTMQHPVGLLTLHGLLLATIVEKRTRPRADGGMPPLRWESDWIALRVDWHSMRKPTAIGAALLLPEKLAIALGLLVLAAGALWMPDFWHPVQAQREYHRAVLAARAGHVEHADAHYNRALALHPEGHDIRSSYSEWLVNQTRSAEALEQLATVRERLNSNELWFRQARALRQLGRESEAQNAYDTYRQRLWQARQFMPEDMP